MAGYLMWYMDQLRSVLYVLTYKKKTERKRERKRERERVREREREREEEEEEHVTSCMFVVPVKFGTHTIIELPPVMTDRIT